MSPLGQEYRGRQREGRPTQLHVITAARLFAIRTYSRRTHIILKNKRVHCTSPFIVRDHNILKYPFLGYEIYYCIQIMQKRHKKIKITRDSIFYFFLFIHMCVYIYIYIILKQNCDHSVYIL